MEILATQKEEEVVVVVVVDTLSIGPAVALWTPWIGCPLPPPSPLLLPSPLSPPSPPSPLSPLLLALPLPPLLHLLHPQAKTLHRTETTMSTTERRMRRRSTSVTTGNGRDTVCRIG
jgi:hypothetical protein